MAQEQPGARPATLIREATLADVGSVVRLHPAYGSTGLDYTAYYAEKARVYITHPDSFITTAWQGDALVGFVTVTLDARGLNQFCKRPGNLLGAAARLLGSRSLWNPRALGSYWQWARQKLREADVAEETVMSEQMGEGGLNAWIGTVETAEQCRGQGVGTAMMRAVEERARTQGVQRLALYVAETNTGAQRFYDRLGYRIVGSVKGAHETRLIAIKDLS
jgi:ribosomal protein S18 acetylase RimI-like enzyme